MLIQHAPLFRQTVRSFTPNYYLTINDETVKTMSAYACMHQCMYVLVCIIHFRFYCDVFGNLQRATLVNRRTERPSNKPTHNASELGLHIFCVRRVVSSNIFTILTTVYIYTYVHMYSMYVYSECSALSASTQVSFSTQYS